MLALRPLLSGLSFLLTSPLRAYFLKFVHVPLAHRVVESDWIRAVRMGSDWIGLGWLGLDWI